MTYEEMKEKVYALDLESLAHGIKVRELPFGIAFEAAGLGIAKMEEFVSSGQADYVAEGYCVIYKGSFKNRCKDGEIEPGIIESLPAEKAFDKYYEMIKDIEKQILNKNGSAN